MPTNNKSWYKKWWGITIIAGLILILGLLTIFIFSFISTVKYYQKYGFNNKTDKQKTDPQKLILITGPANNYWLGAANPKITIVEFSDFTCPHCYASFSTIREIGLKYKKYVKIIYRDFPVLTDYSLTLSLAARCAGEQGLFWPIHDALFLNQGKIKTDKEIFSLTRRIGADETRFQQCFKAKKYLTAIQKDLADGHALGVSGTPTWFINGRKIEGDIPYHIFIKIIDNLMGRHF